jgi:uncharacterized protein (UPF0332 family)
MESSLKTAKHHIENAKKVFSMKIYDLAFISSYNAMFHSARAVLFNDGVIERSHVCIVEYLKSKKMFSKKYVNLLDMYRLKRHATQYGLEVLIKRKEAKISIENAEEFIDAVEVLLDIDKEPPSKQ